MLYDTRWDRTETKADPLSLASLIAWLEKQPPDQAYDYTIPNSCLIAQFRMAAGDSHVCLLSHEVAGLFGGRGADIVQDGVWTFGAALERARKIQNAHTERGNATNG